jgi:hypothetical protein
MKAFNFLTNMFVAMMLPACSTMHINLDERIEESYHQKRRIDYFLGGLYSSENEIRTSSLCHQDQLVNLKFESDLPMVLANYLTLGIWSPKLLMYQCLARINHDELN